MQQQRRRLHGRRRWRPAAGLQLVPGPSSARSTTTGSPDVVRLNSRTDYFIGLGVAAQREPVCYVATLTCFFWAEPGREGDLGQPQAALEGSLADLGGAGRGGSPAQTAALLSPPPTVPKPRAHIWSLSPELAAATAGAWSAPRSRAIGSCPPSGIHWTLASAWATERSFWRGRPEWAGVTERRDRN